MRKKKPQLATLDEVTITKGPDYAEIEYKDESIMGVHLSIGPEVTEMSEEQILELHNDVIRGTAELIRNNPYVATEVPLGSPQIEYSEWGNQWVLRGNVLRCVVSDGGPDGEPTVWVDDRELSWEEFGRTITTYAGWGMRIEFTPEDDIHRRPKLKVEEPKAPEPLDEEDENQSR